MTQKARPLHCRRGILTSPSATVCIATLSFPLEGFPPQFFAWYLKYFPGLPVLDRALYIRGYTPASFANGLAVAVVSARSAVTPTPIFAADSTAPLLFSFTCGTYIDNQAHIVLTWTDPPGNQASFMQLVNDLDLVVVTPSAQVHFFVHIF